MKTNHLIKNELKNANMWDAYKTYYKHKQMKFIISGIAIIFNPDVDINKLIEIEKSIIGLPKNEEMFINAFSSFNELTNVKANWELMARFLFYAFQTSTYWKDEKHKIKNVYNSENYNELNIRKRHLYNSWWKTIEPKHETFNETLIQILRRVY